MLMKWKLRLNFQTIDPSRGGFHEGSSWQKFDHNTCEETGSQRLS